MLCEFRVEGMGAGEGWEQRPSEENELPPGSSELSEGSRYGIGGEVRAAFLAKKARVARFMQNFFVTLTLELAIAPLKTE